MTVDDKESNNNVNAKQGESDGNNLPSTATSTFNWLLGGFMVMLAGATGLVVRKRKRN